MKRCHPQTCPWASRLDLPPSWIKPHPQPMKRQINYKFLAWLIGGVILSAACIHFLHAFQVRRNARSFLYLAEQANEKGDLDKQISYLGRYLKFEPADTDALADYGFALEKRARKAQSPLEWQKRLTQAF